MHKYVPAVITAVVLLSLSSSNAKAEVCAQSADRTGSIDTKAVEKIVIVAGPGDLKIRGEPNRSRIDAQGKACAPTKEILSGIKLVVRRDGAIAYVEAIFPENGKERGWSVSLDLDILVPGNIPVQTSDSSGETEIRNLQSLQIADSSGDLKIEGIAGSLEVQDSSGDIEIDRAGSLRVGDSSGDIRVRQVKGDVEVTADSSGDIEIAEAGGVTVHQDSSGEIRVTDIRGSVRVDLDSSGDINAKNVAGDFTVRADSSGRINFDNVTGKVSVPRK